MALTEIGRAALVAREALRTRAYKDSAGVWTIGVGHTSAAGQPAVTAGLTITEAEAMAIFDRDLAKYEAAVDRAVRVPLADHERDALVSICYNIGPGGFARSTFVKRLNAGDRAGCAAAIMAWTKPPEIATRRAGERDQFLTAYATALPKARSTDRARVRVAPPGPRPAVGSNPGEQIAGGSYAPGAKPLLEQAPPRFPPGLVEASTVRDPRPAAPGVLGGFLARILGRADAAAPTATRLPAEATRGDPAVYRVQRALTDRGYAEVGELDGVLGGQGSKTRAAIRAAQADAGLDVTGEMDAAFLAALPAMPARAIPAARARATVRDLRAAGSTPVAAADGLGFLGRILLGGGALGGVNASGLLNSAKEATDRATATLSTVQAGIDTATAWIQWGIAHWWLLALAGGLYAALRATRYALEIRALYRQGTITRAGA